MTRVKSLRRRGARRSISRLGDSEAARGVSASRPARARLNWAKLPSWLLLLGSVWVLYTLFTDARFRVGQVMVEGAKLVPVSAIERVLDVVGRSVFEVGGEGLEERLMAQFGCIERASVRGRLPNRVMVSISEREAALVWESGGRHWWVADDGTVLGATEDPGELPVVHDVERYAPNPQGRIVGVPWRLAQEMLEALPAIRGYEYTRKDGLILHATADAWPVYLGHDGNAAAKIAIAQALAGELRGQGYEVAIDLRNEGRPIVAVR